GIRNSAYGALRMRCERVCLAAGIDRCRTVYACDRVLPEGELVIEVARCDSFDDNRRPFTRGQQGYRVIPRRLVKPCLRMHHAKVRRCPVYYRDVAAIEARG